MLRLSCPHLVKAIDEYEYKQGGMTKINGMLNQALNSKGINSTIGTESGDEARGDIASERNVTSASSASYDSSTKETDCSVHSTSPSTSCGKTHMSSIQKITEYSPESVALREHFLEINNHWSKFRDELLTDEQKAAIEQKLGAQAAVKFISGGICGISAEKVDDVKCLHIHVADALMRGPCANRFGQMALEDMQAKHGVDPGGCDSK